VSLSNRMAIASPRITAISVEASEFPGLAQRFSVQGVPRTVVNRQGAFVGALPEVQFVSSVLGLAGVNGEVGERDDPGEVGPSSELTPQGD
jgi:thioredoxin-like negative regulator of GroEL